MRTSENKENKKIRKEMMTNKWMSLCALQTFHLSRQCMIWSNLYLSTRKMKIKKKMKTKKKLRSGEKIIMRKKIDKWVVLFPSKHFIFQDIIWANLYLLLF